MGACSWLLAFEFLEFGLAEVFGLVLGVEIEEEDAVVFGDPVVDHPRPSALAVTFGSPAELPAAA